MELGRPFLRNRLAVHPSPKKREISQKEHVPTKVQQISTRVAEWPHPNPMDVTIDYKPEPFGSHNLQVRPAINPDAANAAWLDMCV
jgi:hypothetical protein